MNKIKFTFIGAVDTGKSSCCGQILAKANWIDERSLQKIFDTADKDKMTKSKWARVLDVFEEEILRGKTHEYINIDFTYNDQEYELIDTPGHLIFIREMIAGICGVQIACLLVSMLSNEFDASFERGTLKEHLIIARASGVEKIILLANKMDLISWNKDIYNANCEKVIQFLTKIGFLKTDIITIPISAWFGIGLCDTINMPEWYTGKCLLEELKNIKCKPVDIIKNIKGTKFVIDTRIANYPSIITIGFNAIFHIGGKEYESELIGLKDHKFIKNGDKCITLWKLNDEYELTSDRVIIRKDTKTIGIGKIIKTL